MAWSSSGLGRRPLKAEIGGSNPLQATMISKARSDERAFLLPLRDALTTHFLSPILFIDSPLGLFSTKTFPHFDCVGPFRFHSLFTRFH